MKFVCALPLKFILLFARRFFLLLSLSLARAERLVRSFSLGFPSLYIYLLFSTFDWLGTCLQSICVGGKNVVVVFISPISVFADDQQNRKKHHL